MGLYDRYVACSLCGGDITLPIIARTAEQIAEIVDAHLAGHLDDALPTFVPACNRCLRYAKERVEPGHRLHRPCYAVTCHCDCSYPKEG